MSKLKTSYSEAQAISKKKKTKKTLSCAPSFLVNNAPGQSHF